MRPRLKLSDGFIHFATLHVLKESSLGPLPELCFCSSFMMDTVEVEIISPTLVIYSGFIVTF